MRIYFALSMLVLITILILAFENIAATASLLFFFSYTSNVLLFTLVVAFLGMIFGFLITKIFEGKTRANLDLSADE